MRHGVCALGMVCVLGLKRGLVRTSVRLKWDRWAKRVFVNRRERERQKCRWIVLLVELVVEVGISRREASRNGCC